MFPTTRNPKDFWAGALYLAAGAGMVLMARDHAMGSAVRMGPGYFPTLLGAVLLLFGFLSMARSFLQAGEPVGRLAWRGMGAVIGGTLLFGLLLVPAGLVPALAALVAVSAAGSRKMRATPGVVLGFALFVAFCALLFVQALGLPMPLLGTWFAGGEG